MVLVSLGTLSYIVVLQGKADNTALCAISMTRPKAELKSRAG